MNQNFHYRSLDNYSYLPSIKGQNVDDSRLKKLQSSIQSIQPNIQQPFLVSDRQEWNQQSFIVKKKRKQRIYPPGAKRIDNELEAQFPVHKKFDYVQAHSLGFQGKENVDLFKFYYRLYMKNKFSIQKSRKYKKDQIELIKEEERKVDQGLLAKKSLILQIQQQHASFDKLSKIPQQSSRFEAQQSSSRFGLIQKSQQTEGNSDVLDLNSMEIKDFIIEQGLQELSEYEKMVLAKDNNKSYKRNKFGASSKFESPQLTFQTSPKFEPVTSPKFLTIKNIDLDQLSLKQIIKGRADIKC